MERITAEVLRELLDYNSSTGVFTWRKDRNWRVKSGDVAGTVGAKGYRYINIAGMPTLAHRLAWMHVHGCWPVDQIDHINGVRDDNRLSNLRECDGRENQQNMAARNRKTGKLIGTSWHKAAKKWSAQIGADGCTQYLGLFDTEEEAHEEYLKAKVRLHEFCPAPRKAA